LIVNKNMLEGPVAWGVLGYNLF